MTSTPDLQPLSAHLNYQDCGTHTHTQSADHEGILPPVQPYSELFNGRGIVKVNRWFSSILLPASTQQKHAEPDKDILFCGDFPDVAHGSKISQTT